MNFSFQFIQQSAIQQSAISNQQFCNQQFQGCSLAAIGHEMPMHLRPAELRGFAKDLSEHKVRRILNDAKDRIAAYINDRIDSQAFAA